LRRVYTGKRVHWLVSGGDSVPEKSERAVEVHLREKGAGANLPGRDLSVLRLVLQEELQEY